MKQKKKRPHVNLCVVDENGPRREEPDGIFPLCAAGSRRIVKVVDINGCGNFKMRLAAMGLTPNTEVKVCCALGGPVALEVRGSRISLGRGMAQKVMVMDVGEVEKCDCPDDETRVCEDQGPCPSGDDDEDDE